MHCLLLIRFTSASIPYSIVAQIFMMDSKDS